MMMYITCFVLFCIPGTMSGQLSLVHIIIVIIKKSAAPVFPLAITDSIIGTTIAHNNNNFIRSL